MYAFRMLVDERADDNGTLVVGVADAVVVTAAGYEV